MIVNLNYDKLLDILSNVTIVPSDYEGEVKGYNDNITYKSKVYFKGDTLETLDFLFDLFAIVEEKVNG